MPEPPPGRTETQFDLPTLFGFLWRRVWIIALGVVLLFGLGALYGFTAQPKYAAVAGLVIDDPRNDLSRVSPATAPAAEDLVFIATQIEILRSQDVALSVVDALALVDDPRFVPNRPDLLTAAVGVARDAVRDALDALIGAEEPATEAGTGAQPAAARTPRERAALLVRSNLEVYRIGASRAIDVRYTGNHPELSAEIANAITDAYVGNRIEARFEAAENAGAWLRKRIADLQEQFAQTARRVQAFRAENDIVEVGDGRGLINQQALSQVNQNLVEATAEAAEASARFAQIRRALAQDDLSLERIDAGENEVVTGLRARYLELSSEEATLAERLAAESPALAAVRRELARVEQAIRAELERLAERRRAEQDIALAREQDLRDELARLVDTSNVTEEARVRVQQLESEAEVLQATYESYLKRYTDVIQQQSAPFLQARTISPAQVPTGPTSPKKALILILSAMLGGALGLAAAVLVEGFDRAVRLPRQLEEMGLRTLGVVPIAKASGEAFRRRFGARRAPPAAAAELAFAARAPDSPFANALRRAKTQLSLVLPDAPKGAVIGVTSLSPGEGGSTIAANLARLYAVGGRGTLLVDANLHDDALSRAEDDLEQDTLPGAKRMSIIGSETLVELLRDPADNDRSVRPHGADLLGSQRMRRFVEEARLRNEITILDLPALESVADTAAVAPIVDGLVIVAQWGSTSRSGLEDAVADLRRHGADICGAILNKAHLRAMRSMGHRPTDLGYRPVRGVAATDGDRALAEEARARETERAA